MLPFQRETHWVYKTAQITRIGWFLFHLLFLVLFLSTEPFFWFLMVLFLAAFLIPQWSGNSTESFGIKNYPLLELIFSSIFLIIGCFLTNEYSSFLSVPALIAGVYSKTRKERLFLWIGFAITPLLAVLTIGFDHLGLGVIEGVFFFGIGLAIAKVLEAEKKTKLLLLENRRQNQLLEEYAKQIEKVTLLEERNRLARDLHDTIGHTFTSVIMGLDATAFLLETSPSKAKDHVERLSFVMRNSLNEVRSHIHQIAPTSENEELSLQLQNIANEFALHTKTSIHFLQSEELLELSSQGTITLIRCLQESLTNAIRHGHATEITVTLKKVSTSIHLIISDNGIGIHNVNFGFGLKGMKERLESLQGGLSIESKMNEGTIVTCVLPTIGSLSERKEMV